MNEWMRQEIEDAVADATTTPVVAEWEWVALVAEIMRIVGDTMPPAREGFEWVELPSEMVSDFAADGVPGSRRAAQLIIACREAVARRPKPEPRTERVPWGSHLRGRFVPHEPHAPITRVWCGVDGIERYGGDGWEGSVCSGPPGVPCDDKVEVLVKDGES